jgi:hypothetical protein
LIDPKSDEGAKGHSHADLSSRIFVLGLFSGWIRSPLGLVKSLRHAFLGIRLT